jgi:hypothetical protein
MAPDEEDGVVEGADVDKHDLRVTNGGHDVCKDDIGAADEAILGGGLSHELVDSQEVAPDEMGLRLGQMGILAEAEVGEALVEVGGGTSSGHGREHPGV